MVGIKEMMYSKSPIWMQNILISAYGRKLAHLRYGEIYQRELERLKKRDFSDFNTQKEIQNTMFMDFLHYTLKYSPFYRNFYRNIDFTKIKSVDDIQQLPVLDKETLRQNAKEVFSTENKPYGFSHTGGTTGKSLIVKSFKEDGQKRLAYLDWFKSLYGFEMGKERHARFNGKDIIPQGQKAKVFWRDNRSINQRIYSSFYANKDNIGYYVENLNEYKPVEMDGFCTTIYDIAKYMSNHDIKPAFKPKAIFTTSETVLPHHREMIEGVFDCKIRDQYASSEGAPFIIEMPDGYMHECLDTGVFEHIQTGHQTKLIVTSFTTHGCPLIRYDIGDNIVELEELDNPDISIGFPAIKAIDGRKQDFLYSEQMGYVSAANLSNVIKNLPNSIVNIQFVQLTSNSIQVNAVVDDERYNVEKDEKYLYKEMRLRFGENAQININYVKEIKHTKGGKYQLIINDLCKKL